MYVCVVRKRNAEDGKPYGPTRPTRCTRRVLVATSDGFFPIIFQTAAQPVITYANIGHINSH